MEKHVIEKTPLPNTLESLVNDLRALGLNAGMVVIVHASLSALGWVVGGPVAVIQALMEVLTPGGTLVMPAHSGDYSDPSTWGNPPVPRDWWPEIRKFMPAFHPSITPTTGIGVISEVFRSWPGVLRSAHPAVSFCAWGKHALEITKDHPLDFGLSNTSPLQRIYELNGQVLLLGVDYFSNTSFHLAEYQKEQKKVCECGAPVLEQGQRVWKQYQEIEFETEFFQEIGLDFERVKEIKTGMIGMAESRLFSQRAAVNFATNKFTNARKILV